MPLRVSAPTLANASPSVALEKGAYYRTRASHKRKTSNINSPNPYIHRRGQSRNDQNTKLSALLVFLVLACLTCFGTAYYLFKTRWEAPNSSVNQAPYANMPSPQANVPIQDNDLQEREAVYSEESYLAYLPHSGFHNQRIAFENALVLARLLNRTLIVPPIRLGNKPIPYYPFDRLLRQLALADKIGLKHCAQVSPRLALPSECLDYFDSTHLPWDWLINLTSIKSKQKLHARWNFNEDWFIEHLRIYPKEARYFRDHTPYQYRLVDDAARLGEKTWYTEDITLDFLSQQTQRLLLFGTLFGSTRLRFKEEVNQAVRKEIREAMTITHPILENISESIFGALGGAYLAIHLRASETKFRGSSEINAQNLWWTLLNCFFNATAGDTLELEEQIQGTEKQLAVGPKTTPHPSLSRYCTPLSDVERSLLASASQSKCHQSRASPFARSVLGLSPPFLYIATDLENPQYQPLLARFRAVFPCLSYLSDFTRHLVPLNHLRNPVDGVLLRPHLLPFVDALVAAKALRVVGTKGSTFSYYIEDILWRRIHKLPIKQRG